ncbi:hypothetical protein RLIN73S_01362 [Rhodanobacter lindaniclasticus]
MLHQHRRVDAGPRPREVQQLGQQLHAGLVQAQKAVRRLDLLGQRRLRQQQRDRAAHQAALHGGGPLHGAVRGGVGLQHGAGAAALFQLLRHQVAERAVGQFRQQRAGALGQPCAAVEAGHVDLTRQLVEEVVRQRHRLPDALLEAVLAFPAHQRIGVLAIGQEQEIRLAAVAQPRQRRLQRLPRRGAAGAVAVEAEHHVRRGAEQQLGVFRRGGRAQRGHGDRQPGLVQGDHVHVALDHHDAGEVCVGLLHLPQREQLAALVEQRGLRRVQILRRLLRTQDPSAKRDHPAAPIEDREHQSFAEAVIGVAALAGGDHAGLAQQLHPSRAVAQRLDHAVVAGRRPAEAEARDGVGVQAALGAIRLRVRVARQLLLVPAGAGVEQRVQVGLVLARRRLAAALTRHGEAHRLRQLLHRVGELQPVVVHQELDRAAVHAAAEAVEELLGRADVERGRALVVERAAGGPLAPGLLQRHPPLDHVDDVDAGKQFIDEAVGDQATHKPPSLVACRRSRSRDCFSLAGGIAGRRAPRWPV